ncbi:MAG: hypothetical protein NTW76_08830 [Corynebacteriales bacterium]|nr:hypothetical protein [Mycobacteriales bacterium]
MVLNTTLCISPNTDRGDRIRRWIGGGAQARLLGIFSFGTETVADLVTPGFNAASDVRVAALRWPALRVHLHL